MDVVHRTTLLLTGASGVLGRALIDELADDFDIIALRHRTPVAHPRVTEIVASLSDPTLGLRAPALRDLGRRVDVVLHAAAMTSWKASPEDIRSANLDGTRAMLAFAERAEAPLCFVSTAFVANPPRAASGRFNGALAYIDSKVEAEELVRDSAAGALIVRPSVVTGDSRDGRMAAFQGLHRVCGLVVRGQLPLVACEADTLVDAVPQDLVAAAIGRLLREGEPGEFWLTAGASAMTAGDIIGAALALARELGLDPHAPRFIPAEAVDRLVVPLLDGSITPVLRRRFAELLEMTWLFQSPGALPTSLPDLGFGDQIGRATLRRAFDRSLAYWAQSTGLRPAPAAEDEELAS